ncbi:Telomeric repeat-binding factor 2 [Streptomyces sp. ADI98-10]|nr:Telomeric repeat-binding factor 2 [Streptomyces sp. ADI98-10]
MSSQIPPMPERLPGPSKDVRNPWKTATFCLAGALTVTAAALVYTATEGRGGTPHASADPSPSIWQDDRPRADTTPVATTSPTPSRPDDFKIGDEARNGGAVVTVAKVRETESINVAGAEKKAGDGAKYVILETVVFNDTKASMDLTCSLPIVNNLLDEQDRRYDTIDDLYEVAGNPECNEQLQPGFKDEMLFVYRVPKDAKIIAWEFSEYDLTSEREPSAIELVS